VLHGEPPSPADPPAGCVFHTRCPEVIEKCHSEVPTLRAIAGRRVACWRADTSPNAPKE